MKEKKYSWIILCSFWVCFCFLQPLRAEKRVKQGDDIVSVIRHGVRNDGSVIGTELNELVVKSYGKTLYFPAGTYNLSEPIVLPYDYTKNVNIVFDKNALIKTDLPLEALLKIGYSEMSTPDVTHRRFSYIEGGMFDCYNVENGIMVNGLKQLVSLKNISLFKGRNTHIRISVTDDFRGTGSSDTKIDNVTIQGISSNEEVYGIYIDAACCDCKISNTFIYSTKYGLVTKSAGHILNNLHILSMHTTGGLDLGVNGFRSTEGIRVEADGFFIFNEVYYDTVDRGIVVAADKNPTLILDKNIFYSYLPNFGTSFLYRDHEATTPFQVKMSGCIIEVAKQGYRIFDVSPEAIRKDVEGDFSFMNCAVRNAHLLSPFDFSLMQRMKGKKGDVLLVPKQDMADSQSMDSSQWHVLGAVLASPYRNLLRLDLAKDCILELDLSFAGSEPEINSKMIKEEDQSSFQIGYVIKGEYCILLLRNYHGMLSPVVGDVLGSSYFLSTPSKDRCYGPEDYGIDQEQIVLL
ncbi:right-handed parallel beta-helix repeat-containing protein [uncultured Bacteroides sp.]|uniref:right-handed parallel beta-helix repeat-containing protein n=1 Tax=uncultured Bacteroides sp. TaxID=162156 RepID=UPI00263777C8|nr:right-handed parallel beta-helix repeat-containing protein [uncultured Bacteroides sp.]